MPSFPIMVDPQEQDYLIIEEQPFDNRNKGNLLVNDLISLHTKLWFLAGQRTPTKSDVSALSKHVVSIIKDGSDYTLPSNMGTFESFCTGGGRFLKRNGDSWEEISDSAAVKLVSEQINKEIDLLEQHQYAKEPPQTTEKEGDKEEGAKASPKRQKTNSGKASAKSSEDERFVTTKPNIDDVVLLERKDSTEKTYVDHAGNAFLILEVSQFFTDAYMLSKAVVPGTRADAALATVYSLLGPVKDVGLDGTTSTQVRFLVRPSETSFKTPAADVSSEVWEVLTYKQAAEFVLTLLFDKLVDKENIAATLEKPLPETGTSTATTPIKNFSDSDVLFGRGGLTNSHPGNRRFRDIILLHRPDYIRAIKIEKPNVARRIVRAIRCSDPPGRFLKKNKETGLWYDVGDKHAAEKTSQALREKTQAEKAAKFDDDKRKRLREGGLSQLASQRGLPIIPALPAFSPQDLQRMVQAPYGTHVTVAGVPGVTFPAFGAPIVMPPAGGSESKPKAKSPANGTKSIGDSAAENFAANVAATTAATAGTDDQKIGLDQPREDSEGNILVTDSDVIAGRGGRRYDCRFVRSCLC